MSTVQEYDTDLRKRTPSLSETVLLQGFYYATNKTRSYWTGN